MAPIKSTESADKRRELLSHNEAANIALLDINKLQQVAALHKIIIPKSLLASLKSHFTDLGTEHQALLRHLERYNIANRKLAHQVESIKLEQTRHLQEKGRSLLRNSVESATSLERQVREVQESVVDNDKEIHRLKEDISHTREERRTYTQMFEYSVDKLNALMEQNINRRERESTATKQLKEITSCSERFMNDLETLRHEFEEEQLEREQLVINYETGRGDLSTHLSVATEKNVQLSKSLHEVVSETNALRDQVEVKREEVAQLERKIAEVTNAISQLRSMRDGEVEALSRLEEEKGQIFDKMKCMKGERKAMEDKLQGVTEKLISEICVVEAENKIKEVEKIKIHKELIEADMLEGAETKRLLELNDSLCCRRDKLLKQSSQVKEMKRAIINRNLQLDHCLKLITSSERAQEARLSQLNMERVRLQDDSENATTLLGLIRNDATSIRKAHGVVLDEANEKEEELIRKLSETSDNGNELEQMLSVEDNKKQELREACEKLQDFYRATELLHCHAMEANAIRGKVLQKQNEQMSNNLQYLRIQERKLMPVLQDVRGQFEEITIRRKDIEEEKNKSDEKVQCCKTQNENLQQLCVSQQEELARLKQNGKAWNELEAQHMMQVERDILQLREQQCAISTINKDLQGNLDKLNQLLLKVDHLKKTAPEQSVRLRSQCSQLRRLAQMQRRTYLKLEKEICETEEQTTTEVTQFEKHLREEEDKLSDMETKLRETLLNFEVVLGEMECILQSDD